MLVSENNQSGVFLAAILGGIIIAFIYDIFRVKRRAIRTSMMIVNIEDFTYWILVAICMFGLIYFSNDGEVRAYIFLGIFIGAILYILAFRNYIMKGFITIVKIVIVFLRVIYKIISFPIKIIFGILSPVFYFVAKIGKYVKRRLAGTNKIIQARKNFMYKFFRNIRKKI